MKIVYIILIILLLTLPITRYMLPGIAMVVHITLLVSGITFDIVDFLLCMISAIRRKRVPSANMFFGFILMGAGIYGIVFPASTASSFEGINWKRSIVFLCLLVITLFLHLFIHILLPLIFTVACNLYYGRKLFDMTTLPQKTQQDK